MAIRPAFTAVFRLAPVFVGTCSRLVSHFSKYFRNHLPDDDGVLTARNLASGTSNAIVISGNSRSSLLVLRITSDASLPLTAGPTRPDAQA